MSKELFYKRIISYMIMYNFPESAVKFSIIILYLLFISVSIPDHRDLSGFEITKKMFTTTKRIRTMTFNLRKMERIDGKINESKCFIKLNNSPFRIYLKQNDGVEVLYATGYNNDNVLINPNGFPWFNINVDPVGSLMRKNQHHTIFDSGYDHVISILEFLYKKYGEETETMIKSAISTTFDGYPCWLVEFNNPYFKYLKYRIKEGETVLTIAEKFNISEYMILENNKDVDDYYDVVKGQIILIPNDYSPKMVMFIDKQRMIPLVMKIYDDKGLYEQYEYTNIKVNPVLKPEEFTEGYSEYNF